MITRVSVLAGLLGFILVIAFALPASSQVSGGLETKDSPQLLSCSPAPCILPNVRLFTYGMGGEYPTQAVVNPANTSQMMVAAIDGNCNTVGIFASEDGGVTWPIHRCIGTINATGDTVASYDFNGVGYAGGSDDLSSMSLRSSADNGKHWSSPRVVDVEASGLYSVGLAVDTSPASPFPNRLYVSSVHGGIYSLATRIHVSFSADGIHWGRRFLDKWQANNIDFDPHLSLGEDGTAYVTWLRCMWTGGPCHKNGVPILLSKSTDGGDTWSAPVVVARTNLVSPDDCGHGCLPNTSAPITNVPVTSIVGSGASAMVYVVFYNWTGTQMQVQVATSSDGGGTFGAPVRVSTSTFGDQFFQWISATYDGTLAVTWMDRRNDPANTKYQPFFATSKDGVVFSPSRSLSTTLSDPALSFAYLGGGSPNLWLGDTLYQVWMDTRSGQPRIELGGVQF